jgi:hypothetical protein
MKAALHFVCLLGFVALAGCQTSETSALNKLPRQSRSVRIEFTRRAWIYEKADAVFSMVNGTHQVLWFTGQGPESPTYQVKIGSSILSEQNAPAAGKDANAPERFALLPGERKYFEANAADATRPASVGVTFYPSRTGTNGITVWSSASLLSAKGSR